MAKNKHIRPLTLYKKNNPEAYRILLQSDIGGLVAKSKKDQENNCYYLYAWHFSGIEYRVNEDLNPFFIDRNTLKFVRKTIVTELGRLLLTGWYYNAEDWARTICGYVYNSYCTKGDQFNEYRFTAAVKHIRENIGYYYHNPDELKLYILENFFAEELKKMLPEPPKQLQDYEKAVQLLGDYEKKQLKQNRDYYRDRTLFLEDYVEHLQSIIHDGGIAIGEDEFKRQYDINNSRYWQEIASARQQYRQQILRQLPEITNNLRLQ